MRTITDNVRLGESLSIMHLFEFELNDLDNNPLDKLYFTDHDIFVNYGGVEYVPISITFNEINENITMSSSTVSLQLDNINDEITSLAFNYEWRNNKAKITRVIYSNKIDTIDGVSYEFGYGDNLNGYPLINLDTISKDVYVVFEGIINSFSATRQSASLTLSSKFASWSKPYPKRTYNQNEFNTIIDAISDTVYWGRVKDE